MLRWAEAFAITLAIELPIAAFFLRRAEPRRGRLLAMLVFANLATHPLVWFAFPTLPLSSSREIALAELFAWAAEALFYRSAFAGVGLARAAAVSLLANGASFGLGLVLYLALGWPA